jgi:hypothetical protein
MMKGKITRTLKLRLGVTEIRDLTIRTIPRSEFSPQDSKNGLSFGFPSPFCPAQTGGAALCVRRNRAATE